MAGDHGRGGVAAVLERRSDALYLHWLPARSARALRTTAAAAPGSGGAGPGRLGRGGRGDRAHRQRTATARRRAPAELVPYRLRPQEAVPFRRSGAAGTPRGDAAGPRRALAGCQPETDPCLGLRCWSGTVDQASRRSPSARLEQPPTDGGRSRPCRPEGKRTSLSSSSAKLRVREPRQFPQRTRAAPPARSCVSR